MTLYSISLGVSKSILNAMFANYCCSKFAWWDESYKKNDGRSDGC